MVNRYTSFRKLSARLRLRSRLRLRLRLQLRLRSLLVMPLLVMPLLAVPLAGPAQAASADEPLRVWTRSSKDGRKTYDAIAAAFTKQTGIRVEYFNAMTDFEPRLARAAVGGRMPDVIVNEIGAAGQLVNMGVAAEIDRSRIAGGDRLLDSAWRAATLPDGKTYGVPVSVQTHVLFIRRDWREKLGLPVPRTWDELAALSLAFTERDPDGNGRRDTYGLALAGTAARGYAAASLSSFLFQAGGEFQRRGADGRAHGALDEPAASATLTFFRRLVCEDRSVQPNAINAATQDTNKAFSSGQAGIYLSGPYHIALFDKEPGRARYEVVPLPAGPTGQRASMAGGELAYLTTRGRHPGEARRFVEFLISPQGQTMGMQAADGGLPVVRLPVDRTLDAGAIHGDARWAMVADEYRSHGHPMPQARNWSRLQQLAADGFNAILAHCSQDIPGELRALNQRFNAELARQEAQ
ncbi:ABC transporter substrate-binding protein [Roseateles chitinivorans]|uniref:ABC transporter substrate-binding protein n=1 Tax=Roseateles chitinivorans TaxID=2917965 RepID=UPI003D66F6F0